MCLVYLKRLRGINTEHGVGDTRRERETERERQTDREGERERQTDRQTERHTESERGRAKWGKRVSIN